MVHKTRKNSHLSRLPKYSGTMKGVQEWYVAEFEKLGWMVLAKAKGYKEKISAYKKAIDHLLKTIEHIKEEYESANKKHDLNVVHMNTEVLKEFVAKNF
jgi:hypothetical protein